MKLLNYINGEHIAPSAGNYLDLINPAEGKVYGQAPASTGEDVELAITAAKEAFLAWSNTPASERSAILHRIAGLIEANLEDLAQAESLDNGKPVKLATKVDIPRAASNFRFFAEAITQYATKAHDMQGLNAINYTTRDPLGVVVCISPWNLPLYLFTWKIAPALAAGNTVVAKPSEVTPLTAYKLSELCKEAGLPAGVLNIIHGYGHEIGDALTSHDHVKAVTFTGSTAVGKRIASITAPLFKKVSLEMGGKNPNIIFADCDYENTLSTTLQSSFANQGQICLCGSRILVESSIYEQFKADFVAKTQGLVVGHPSNSSSNLGAIVSKQHYDKILACIDLALAEGGQILAGGKAGHVDGYPNGYYIQPTIIEGLDMQCKTNQEEIFGPVVTIMPFVTEAEAIELANATQYGLSSTVWTQDISRAHRVAKGLQAGIVWINTWLLRDLRTPFGGVKHSGVGREGGEEALRFFTEPKNVCIKY